MEKANGTNPMAEFANYASGSNTARQYLSEHRQQPGADITSSQQLSFERQFFEQPRVSMGYYNQGPAADLGPIGVPPSSTAQQWADEYSASPSSLPPRRSIRMDNALPLGAMEEAPLMTRTQKLAEVYSTLDYLAQAKMPAFRQVLEDWQRQYPSDIIISPTSNYKQLTAYNSDFDKLSENGGVQHDGDERNIHYPQTRAATEEAAKYAKDLNLVWDEQGWFDNASNHASIMYDQNLDFKGETAAPLLTVEEVKKLQQIVADTYGFNVNELLWSKGRHISILDKLPVHVADRLARDVNYSELQPVPIWKENMDRNRAMVDNYLIYEGLVATYLGKDLFDTPGKNIKENDVDGEYIPDIIDERLMMLNTLQYGVLTQTLTMSDQQLLDYVLQADYIPDTVLTTLYEWFFNEHKTVGTSAITFRSNRDEVLDAFKVHALAMKEGRKPLQLHKPAIPKSSQQLDAILRRRHLSYEALAQSLSPLEIGEMECYITPTDIDQRSFTPSRSLYSKAWSSQDNYGYLPKTREELAEVIEAGDLKLYPLEQLRAIVGKLQLLLPVDLSKGTRKSKKAKMLRQLLTDTAAELRAQQLQQLQSKSQPNNIKALSREFSTAYKAGDYATVVNILDQTDKLVVPLNFSLFSAYALSSKRDKITNLLLDKIQSGQLQLVNSASHL